MEGWVTAGRNINDEAPVKTGYCEKSLAVPQKVGTRLSYDPHILLLDIYLKELKAVTLTGICTNLLCSYQHFSQQLKREAA